MVQRNAFVELLLLLLSVTHWYGLWFRFTTGNRNCYPWNNNNNKRQQKAQDHVRKAHAKIESKEKRRKGVKKTNGNLRGVLAAFHHHLCLLNSRANYMRKKKAHGNCLWYLHTMRVVGWEIEKKIELLISFTIETWDLRWDNCWKSHPQQVFSFIAICICLQTIYFVHRVHSHIFHSIRMQILINNYAAATVAICINILPLWNTFRQDGQPNFLSLWMIYRLRFV